LQGIVRPDREQLVDATGNIVLGDRSIERLQLVVDVLVKNLVLSWFGKPGARPPRYAACRGAIDRKLDFSRTVETLFSLEQTRSNLQVEWYIVVLIVVELVLDLYSVFPRH